MTNNKTVVRHAEDAKPTPFPWGDIRWLFHRHLAADAEMTFGVVRIMAGEQNPRHSHSNCEELLYLLEGEIDHCVGDRRIHATPGTLVRFPRNVEHHAENTGDKDALMVVCYSSPVRKTKTAAVLKRAGETRDS